MSDYLTVLDAARQLGIEEGAVIVLIRTGKLHGVHAPDRDGWLVHRDEVTRYAAASPGR